MQPVYFIFPSSSPSHIRHPGGKKVGTIDNGNIGDAGSTRDKQERKSVEEGVQRRRNGLSFVSERSDNVKLRAESPPPPTLGRNHLEDLLFKSENGLGERIRSRHYEVESRSRNEARRPPIEYSEKSQLASSLGSSTNRRSYEAAEDGSETFRGEIRRKTTERAASNGEKVEKQSREKAAGNTPCQKMQSPFRRLSV